MCIVIIHIGSMLTPYRKVKYPRDQLVKLYQVNYQASLQDIFTWLIFLFSCIDTLKILQTWRLIEIMVSVLLDIYVDGVEIHGHLFMTQLDGDFFQNSQSFLFRGVLWYNIIISYFIGNLQLGKFRAKISYSGEISSQKKPLQSWSLNFSLSKQFRTISN